MDREPHPCGASTWDAVVKIGCNLPDMKPLLVEGAERSLFGSSGLYRAWHLNSHLQAAFPVHALPFVSLLSVAILFWHIVLTGMVLHP